jgi:hypothetical protein
VIDETKRLIIEEDMMTNMDDSDDDRLDFIDAQDEEITDKITNEFRRKRRPLKASEIERISRGLVEGLKESVLS